MSVDQLLYEWLETRFDADGTLSGLDVETVRDDWPEGKKQGYPRIEYNADRGPGDPSALREFGLTVKCNRDRAFGGNDMSNAGPLSQIMDAVVTSIANQRPTLSGVQASAITVSFSRRTTLSDQEIVSDRIDCKVYIDESGSSVPLMGSEASLAGSGINGVVERWRVAVGGPQDTLGSSRDSTTPTHTLGDAIVTGFMDIVLTSTADLPNRGTTLSAITFTAESGVTWDDDLLITEWAWDPSDYENPQHVRMFFAVTNASSPFRQVA